MSYKLGFLAGAAAGYVLGSKAGRSRYEDIKKQSLKAWNSDPVQSTLTDAAGAVGEAVKAKTPQAAHGLVDKAVSAVQNDQHVTPANQPGGQTGQGSPAGTTTPSAAQIRNTPVTGEDAPKGPAIS